MPTILFDQTPLPAGIINESRDDIVVGNPMTITAGSVVGTADFGVLGTSQPSAAVLSGTGNTRTFTPDVTGTYRIRISDDSGLDPVTHTFTVVTALGLKLPAPNERSNPNANDVDPDIGGVWVNESETNKGGSFEGWHPGMIANLLLLEASILARLPLAGGTMSGQIDMAQNDIIGVAGLRAATGDITVDAILGNVRVQSRNAAVTIDAETTVTVSADGLIALLSVTAGVILDGITGVSLRQGNALRVDVNAAGAVAVTPADGQIMTVGAVPSPAPNVLVYVQKDQNAETDIRVENATVGTGAGARLVAEADAGAVVLTAYSSAFTTVGSLMADAGELRANSDLSGGLNIVAQAPDAPIRFYAGDTGTIDMQIDADGTVNVLGSVLLVGGVPVVVVTRQIIAGPGLVGTGDLSADVTLGLASPNISPFAGGTGWLKGGTVTEASPTTIDTTSGAGRLTNYADPTNPVITEVSWTPQIGVVIAAVAVSDVTLIAYDITGALVQILQSVVTREDFRNFIFVGQVGHAGGVIVGSNSNVGNVAYDGFSTLGDFLEVIGPTQRFGVEVTANATGNLTADHDAGQLFIQNQNARNDPTVVDLNPITAASPYLMRRAYRDNLTNSIKVQNTVPDSAHVPSLYDNGSGTLQTVPTNDWTNQRVFVSAVGSVLVAFGQTVYNTKSAALAALQTETFVEQSPLPTFALRSFLTVRNNATDLTDTAQAVFTRAPKFRLFGTSGGGVQAAGSFIALTDTPGSYAGQSLRGVRVNLGETALEFADFLTAAPPLQDVVNVNAAAAISAATGAFALSNNTDTDITPVMTLTRAPGAATVGGALNVVMGANATGDGINVDFNSTFGGARAILVDMDAAATGVGIDVVAQNPEAGTPLRARNSFGTLIDTSGLGALTLSANNDKTAQLSASGSGGVNVHAQGTGPVDIQAFNNQVRVNAYAFPSEAPANAFRFPILQGSRGSVMTDVAADGVMVMGPSGAEGQPGAITQGATTYIDPSNLFSKAATGLVVNDLMHNGTGGLLIPPAAVADGDFTFGIGGDVRITKGAASDNIFATGGTVTAVFRVDDIDGLFGAIIGTGTRLGENGWQVIVSDLLLGECRISFSRVFATTGGRWDSTARVITLADINKLQLSYSDATPTTAPAVLLNGVVVPMTEILAPVGAAGDDAADPLRLGNDSSGGFFLEGALGPCLLHDRVLTTAEAVRNAKVLLSRYLQVQPFGIGDVTGLHIANGGANPDEVIDIDTGQAASNDGRFLITLPSALPISIAVSGLGGLDTGVVTLNEWYGVWLIADSSGVNPTSAVFSLAATNEDAPTFPVGYNRARRIGAVHTDATSDILPYDMPKSSNASRWVTWKNAAVVQPNGTEIVYTDTFAPASTRVAPSAVRQQVGMRVVKLGGTSINAQAEVIPDGWNEAAGNNKWVVGVGVNSAEDITVEGIFEMPVGPNRLLRYLIAPAGDASTTIEVKGWEDAL